jgi:hypothetical protein
MAAAWPGLAANTQEDDVASDVATDRHQRMRDLAAVPITASGAKRASDGADQAQTRESGSLISIDLDCHVRIW